MNSVYTRSPGPAWAPALGRPVLLLVVLLMMALVLAISSAAQSQWNQQQSEAQAVSGDMLRHLEIARLELATEEQRPLRWWTEEQIGDLRFAMSRFEGFYHEHYQRASYVQEAYGSILTEWYGRTAQLITMYQLHPAASATLLQVAPEVDVSLVTLSRHVEEFQIRVAQHYHARLNLLRFIQLMACLLMFGALLALMHFLRTEILYPAHVLRRELQLLQRLQPTGSGPSQAGLPWAVSLAEQVGESVTLMTDVLQEKDTRIQQQEEACRQVAARLAFLHQLSQLLNEAVLGQRLLSQVIRSLSDAVGCKVKLYNIDGQPYDIARDYERIRHIPLGDDVSLPPGLSQPYPMQHTLPLLHQNFHFGWIAALSDKVREGEDAYRILESTGRLLALCLSAELRAKESRRIALLEGRAVIARELHDSIAQTLSYLKVQVSRLKLMLEPQQSTQADEVMGELREGLNSAYSNLRQLLTTFRSAEINEDLGSAIRKICDEFRQKSHICIDLDFRLSNVRLTAQEEIQVLFIVREAITNTVRHAGAKRVFVSLQEDQSRAILVRIRDDGAGFDPKSFKQGHYGLQIMGERAASINGELQIFAPAGGGTEVQVRFHQAEIA